MYRKDSRASLPPGGTGTAVPTEIRGVNRLTTRIEVHAVDRQWSTQRAVSKADLSVLVD